MVAYNKATGASGTLRINVTVTQNVAANQSTFTFSHQIINSSGATFANGKSWSASAAGVSNSGTFSINGVQTVTLWSGTRVFTHDANGNLSSRLFDMTMGATGTAGLAGPTYHSATVTAPRIVKAPGAPGAPTYSAITPATLTLAWTAAARGSSNITRYEYQYATTASFTGATLVNAGNVLTSAVTGLVPATLYYFRVRAINADGTGTWSTASTVTTLPATPPGMVIVPSPAGSAATVTLTPPSGISGVDKYTVTRTYISPAPIPSPATVVTETLTNTLNVTGLVQGAVYQWTATATIGGYTTGASAPQNILQPSPSTSPGDYFDGNTTDTADAIYAWTGTTNNSTSTESTPVPVGWITFGDGDGASGGTGVVSSVLGGASLGSGLSAGLRSVRVSFFSDASAAGFQAGTTTTNPGRTAVADGGVYWGSIYVFLPARNQRLAAMIQWVDIAGAPVGSPTIGVDTLVGIGVWQRLSVIGEAPVGATHAAVRVIDVAGTGWSTWKGGDSFLLDAAMISLGELYTYFDGSSPDTVGFRFDWLGTANASESTRTALTSFVDPLRDPDCPPIPAPPRPPIVPSDCIQDVGQWRRYWAQIPATNVSDWLATIPTLELETLAEAERQVRIRYYANPFNRGSDQVNTDDFCSEQIISFIPAATTMTIDGISQRVWAEVGGGASIPADHLLYGSDGTPASWPHLSCGIGYWISLDVPVTSLAGNLNVRAFVTQRV